MSAAPGPLILASTSRYRRALLDRLRVPYEARSPRVDEDSVHGSGASAEQVAQQLARAKAESLARSHPQAYVLGSDQVPALDDVLLTKPGDLAGCKRQLTELAGRTHRLVTAVALRHPDGRVTEALDVHLMTMRALSPLEIVRYVDAERPTDCAGSYKIEGLGVALFDRVDGADATAIIGMPLMAVARLLRDAGFAVP